MSLMTSPADKGRNFEIHISLLLFELERQTTAKNIRKSNGHLSGIFNFRYHLQWKSLSRAQIAANLKKFKYQT